ncbi:MAG: beta-N-acetylglucosaminidase domain-containing protein [Coprobacillaceae bacterium]
MVNTNTNIKDVLINDYSDNANRGTIEGFYGVPWSNDTRKDIIEMMGEYKMNEYIYAPKDDPYHYGKDWYNLYPADELSQMKNLVDTAKDSNVEFIYTLHVSNYMDLTDDDDAANSSLPEKTSAQWALDGSDNDRGVYVPVGQHDIDAYDADETWNQFIAKFDQMYNIGVRRFGILADDISFPVARYSIPYLVNFMNDLQEYLMTNYEDVEPLMFCPSYYYQADARFNGRTYMSYIKDGYNQQITNGLDSKVEVMWTGAQVMSNVNSTNNAFMNTWIGKDPLIWWNYPVTDYVPSYVLLGPNPGLNSNATNMTGIISNPMQQGFASEISLFGVADYAWNLEGYDRYQSWQDSFSYLFPDVADSLYLIAQHATTGYSTTALDQNEESTYLKPYLTAFEDAVNSGDEAAIATAGTNLTVQFDNLLNAINDVRNNCTSSGLVEDLNPWLDKLESICITGNAIIKAYTSLDTVEIWNAYSLVNAEVSSWPTITVEQLEGGTVAAEIGKAHLTPFINTMISLLEDRVNSSMLTGDKITVTNDFMTNVPDLEGISVVKEDNNFTISNMENIDLEPYHFVGMKLEKTYLIDSISFDIDGDVKDKISVECSVNGLEWSTLDIKKSKSTSVSLENSPIRYVRIVNNTNIPANIDINLLQVTIVGAKPTVVTSATSTAGIYQNHKADNLVDGNYTTPYWTNANQLAGQEVVITYDEEFELYDFSLYEATTDYIRNGSIYASTDNVQWDKIGDIGSNFVTETVDGNTYNVIRGHASGKVVKYIKIATESTANNWTKLHEWSVNQTVEKDSGVMYPFNSIVNGQPI